MAGICFVLVLAAAGSDHPGAFAAPSVAAPAVGALQSPTRSPYELRAAIRDALRRSARRSNPDPYQLVPELVALYEELRGATGMAREARLRYRGLLRLRLKDLEEDLSRELAEAEKQPAAGDAGAGPPAAGQADRVAAGVHAQQFPQFQQPQAGAGFPPILPRGQPGLPPADNGAELVALIKRTIAPESWDDAGGPGTIYYYRPLQVLVIRQTGGVQNRIGDALQGLRKP